MNLEQHQNRDDMKVWLSTGEIDQLLEHVENSQERIAIGLGVRCGLRSHEILDVAPAHIHDTDAGAMLRVWHGKGDKYRETPVPTDLAAAMQAYGDVRNEHDESIIDITTTRSLRRLLSRVTGRIESDDPGWSHLSMHDLRRTWATQLQSQDVDPIIVLDWGGWNDLDTFLKHYRGKSTPEAQLRERSKVDWL
jgi:integrase